MEGSAKKTKKAPVLTKTPVWQALAVLSWAKEIVISEILARESPKVCEFNCKGCLDLSKWQRSGVATYAGIEHDANLLERAKKMAAKGGAGLASQFEGLNVFRDDLKLTLPPSMFDCVAMFNDGHLLMESEESARCCFSNAAHLLRPGAFFIGLIHDGSAIWYALQKEQPEAPVPDDYAPAFRRSLFTVSTGKMVEQTVGAEYRFKVRKEERSDTSISVRKGYLVNPTHCCRLAQECGLSLVHMINAGEFFELYRTTYGEALKKKAGSKEILREQREVIDMHAFFIFQKATH